MPFNKLNSLHITAIILQYVGKKKAVCQLLQLLTHTSRAYCRQKVDGLVAFIIDDPKMEKKLNLRVQVRDPWRRQMPFAGFDRRVTALILSYTSYKD